MAPKIVSPVSGKKNIMPDGEKALVASNYDDVSVVDSQIGEMRDAHKNLASPTRLRGRPESGIVRNDPKDAVDQILHDTNNGDMQSQYQNSARQSPSRRMNSAKRFAAPKEPQWQLTPSRLATFEDIQKGEPTKSPYRTLAGFTADWDPEREEEFRKEAEEKAKRWNMDQQKRREETQRMMDEEMRRREQDLQKMREMELERERQRQEETHENLMRSKEERERRRLERERQIREADDRLRSLREQEKKSPPLFKKKEHELQMKDRERLEMTSQFIKETKSQPIKNLAIDEHEQEYLKVRQERLDAIRAEQAKEMKRLAEYKKEVDKLVKNRSSLAAKAVEDYQEQLAAATAESKIRMQRLRHERQSKYGQMVVESYKQQAPAPVVPEIPKHPSPFRAGKGASARSSPSRFAGAITKSKLHHEVYEEVPEEVLRAQAETQGRYSEALHHIQSERKAVLEKGIWRSPTRTKTEEEQEVDLVMQRELDFLRAERDRANQFLAESAYKRQEKAVHLKQKLEKQRQNLQSGTVDAQSVADVEKDLVKLEQQMASKQKVSLARGKKEEIKEVIQEEKMIADAYIDVIKSKLELLNGELNGNSSSAAADNRPIKPAATTVNNNRATEYYGEEEEEEDEEQHVAYRTPATNNYGEAGQYFNNQAAAPGYDDQGYDDEQFDDEE